MPKPELRGGGRTPRKRQTRPAQTPALGDAIAMDTVGEFKRRDLLSLQKLLEDDFYVVAIRTNSDCS